MIPRNGTRSVSELLADGELSLGLRDKVEAYTGDPVAEALLAEVVADDIQARREVAGIIAAMEYQLIRLKAAAGLEGRVFK